MKAGHSEPRSEQALEHLTVIPGIFWPWRSKGSCWAVRRKWPVVFSYVKMPPSQVPKSTHQISIPFSWNFLFQMLKTYFLCRFSPCRLTPRRWAEGVLILMNLRLLPRGWRSRLQRESSGHPFERKLGNWKHGHRRKTSDSRRWSDWRERRHWIWLSRPVAVLCSCNRAETWSTGSRCSQSGYPSRICNQEEKYIKPLFWDTHGFQQTFTYNILSTNRLELAKTMLMILRQIAQNLPILKSIITNTPECLRLSSSVVSW